MNKIFNLFSKKYINSDNKKINKNKNNNDIDNKNTNKLISLKIDLKKEILSYLNLSEKINSISIVNKQFKSILDKSKLIRKLIEENLLKKFLYYFKPNLEEFINNNLKEFNDDENKETIIYIINHIKALRKSKDINIYLKIYAIYAEGNANNRLFSYLHEDEPTSFIKSYIDVISYKTKLIKLYSWDLNDYDLLNITYKQMLKKPNGIMFVFDLDSKTEFEKIKQRIKEFIQNIDNDIIILVGCKIFFNQKEKISKHEIDNFCKNYKLDYCELCLNDNLNTEKAYESLIEKIISYSNFNKKSYNEIYLGNNTEINIREIGKNKKKCFK